MASKHEIIFEQYKNLWPKYFAGDGKYKYGSCDNWLLVLTIPTSDMTVTNENRDKIYDPIYAEYTSTVVEVILIVSKIFPHEKIDKVAHLELCQIINYEVGKCTTKDNYRLHYFNSLEPAYFEDMVHAKYTGYYIAWFDNGAFSEKGNYLNGQKHGVWYFGSPCCKEEAEQVIREVEYENGSIKNNIGSSYQIVKWMSRQEQLENMGYLGTVVTALYDAAVYVDEYIPKYLKWYPLNWFDRKHS